MAFNIANMKGLKWKNLDDNGAQFTIPASSASAHEIKGILENTQGQVAQYSISVCCVEMSGKDTNAEQEGVAPRRRL